MWFLDPSAFRRRAICFRELGAGIALALPRITMDDETIDEAFQDLDDTMIDTVQDNRALDSLDDEDRTLLTSAAPDHDESPWSDRSRGAVSFASGSI
jgi:hypothetical protein